MVIELISVEISNRKRGRNYLNCLLTAGSYIRDTRVIQKAKELVTRKFALA